MASPAPQGSLRRAADAALPVALLAGAAWVLYGVISTGLFSQSLWQDPRGSLSVVLASAIALAAWARVSSRRAIPFSWGLLAGAAALAMPFAGLGACAAVALVLASGFALGRRLVPDASCGELHPVAALLAPAALGLAVLATLVYGLAFTGFSNPLVFLILLLGPLLVGARSHAARARALVAAWRESTTHGPAWEWGAWILVGVACTMRLLAALHPEIGTDALAAHLVVADRLRETGRFHFDVTQSIWAVMPMAADWLLAIPYMFAGEMGSRLLNFGAEAMLIALAWASARRWAGAQAATITALVLGTTPLLYRESSTIFIENVWSLWVGAALVFAAATVPGQDRRQVAASAILLGTALAAKVMTVFFAPFFLCVAVAWLREDARRAVGSVVLAALLALLVAAGPYLYAWLHTGNPVFPFMNSLFGSPLFDRGNFDNPLYSGGLGWNTPFAMHFDTPRYIEGRNGAMGLLFLLSLPACVVALPRLAPRLRWAFACSLLGIGGVFAFQHYLRYILPVLPVLAVVAGAAIAPLFRTRAIGTSVAVILLLAGLANLWLAAASTWQYARVALPPFPGSRAAETFRLQNVPETHAVDVLNALGARRVLWVAKPAIANARADIFVTNWHGWNVAQQLRGIQDLATMQRWMAANRIDAVVVGPDQGLPDPRLLLAYLDRNADRVGAIGDVAVFAVRPEALFVRELLVNPDFNHGAGGWAGEGEWTGAGSVLVTSARPLVQTVPVRPGQQYLLDVEAVCSAGSAPYRLQVNWQDTAGAMIDASIQVRECGGSTRPWAVSAPPRAARAQVYASGHLADPPVELTRISLRQ